MHKGLFGAGAAGGDLGTVPAAQKAFPGSMRKISFEWGSQLILKLILILHSCLEGKPGVACLVLFCFILFCWFYFVCLDGFLLVLSGVQALGIVLLSPDSVQSSSARAPVWFLCLWGDDLFPDCSFLLTDIPALIFWSLKLVIIFHITPWKGK